LVGRIGKKNRFGFSVGIVHRFGFQIRHQDTLDWTRLAVDRDRPLWVRPSRHLLHDVQTSLQLGSPVPLFDQAVTGPTGERAFYDTGSSGTLSRS
jgi:hypothetical protein